MNSRLKNILYKSTRVSQVLLGKGNSAGQKVLFFPAFKSIDALADQVNRAKWYMPTSGQADIIMAVDDCLKGAELDVLKVPDFQRTPTLVGGNPSIRLIKESELKAELKRADVICVWDTTAPDWFRTLLPKFARLRIIDPDFYLFSETHTNAALLWYDLLSKSERASWLEDSSIVAKGLFEEFGASELAYVFGTGPSIKEADKHTYGNGVRIICNSMVKNDKLLERIRPQVLVFADCVFHFGVSKYAEQFASDVLKVVERYNTRCVTTRTGYALMRAHYPELKDHLISIEATRFGKSVRLTQGSFKARAHDNILTRLMLPLAAGLSKDVVMMGFDGRKPEENYFWQHNPSTQYTGEMEGVHKTHPAFFRDIGYAEYYEKHCATLSEMLDTFEKAGNRFTLWGDSYIPALVERSLKTTQ